MVKIEQDNYLISFSFSNSKSNTIASKAINMEKGKSEFHDYYREDPTVVMFNDVMADVDLAYTIRENYLKEDIILNKKPSSNEFVFSITTQNLNIVLKDDKLFYNDSKSGEEVFTTADLFMEDSTGNVSTNVSMKLDSAGENQYSPRLRVFTYCPLPEKY